MSKDRRPNETLNEQDIQDYLAGRISGRKAHDIERYLLDHPFEREAMEGFDKLFEQELEQDLELLRQRLQHRNKPIYGMLKIAAAVALLLLSLASVWIYIDSVEPESGLALNETDQAGPMPKSEKEQEPEPPVAPESEADQVKGTTNIEKIVIQPEDEVDEEIALREAPATAEVPLITQRDVAIPQGEKKEETRNAEDQAKTEETLIDKSSIAYDLVETEPPVTVEPEQVAVRGLTAARSISNEMVVMEQEKKAKKKDLSRPMAAILAPDSDMEAQPIGDFESFDQYVKANLKYPEVAKMAGTQGEVILAVHISQSGEITEVKVVDGIGEACNKEAIRLVMEGPVWDPAIQNGVVAKDTVQVIIRFELPKK